MEVGSSLREFRGVQLSETSARQAPRLRVGGERRLDARGPARAGREDAGDDGHDLAEARSAGEELLDGGFVGAVEHRAGGAAAARGVAPELQSGKTRGIDGLEAQAREQAEIEADEVRRRAVG